MTSPSAKANLRNLFFDKKASPIIRSWSKSSTAMTAASAPSFTRPTQYAGHAEIRARRSDEEDFHGGAASPAECRGCPFISKLSTRKIHKIINGFGEAAVLAVKAGFDMVQVHGDRMCGSFSSTVSFNHRTDEYGGSAENRARFAVEAVKGHPQPPARHAHRFQAAGAPGRSPLWQRRCSGVELGIFVPLLTDAGVTSFHVTLANHSSLEDTIPRPTTRTSKSRAAS